MTSLAELELRLDLVRDHLGLIPANDDVSSLERRASQSTVALARCRRCDFGPQMRSLLEMKIRLLETDVARAAGDETFTPFAFFR